MKTPTEVLGLLQKDRAYKDWAQRHQAFLTHFFCAIDSQGEPVTKWEIGYWERETGLITVFSFAEDEAVIVKPADEVFKRETDTVEELDIKQVRLSLEEVRKIFFARKEDYFPQELLGNGFLILQSWRGKMLWNFTFITKTLKFVNVKINAATGEISEHNSIDLVEKKHAT